MHTLKYTGLALSGGIFGLLAVTILVFIFSVTIPLPLTKEQRAEIAAYAPETDSVAVFQTELWRAANITMTEVITIRRQGNQITVDRFWFPHMSWDVGRTIRERKLKQRMDEVAPQVML